MNNKRIAVVMLLFIITMLVLSLHIIDIASENILTLVQIIGNTTITTISEYQNDNAIFFGKYTSLNFLYDLVLYAIIGCIIVCLVLVLLLDEKDIENED